jgi:hypothetical protein
MLLDKWGWIPPEPNTERRPHLIEDVIAAFAKDVIKRGENTIYTRLYTQLAEYIQDNEEDFVDETPF